MAFNSSGEWTLPKVTVMGIWLSFIILIGVFGNIMVIIVSVQGTRVRTKGKYLIASLAVADTVESFNIFFMLITAGNYGEWIFGELMCTLHGFITTQFVIASMYSLMTISINRYVLMAKSHLYKKLFSKRNMAFTIAFIWMFPLVFSVPPLFGWSKYEFQSNKLTCMFYLSTSMTYAFGMTAFCVPLPLSVIAFCCYNIYKKVKEHQTQIGQANNQGATANSNLNVEEIRITKTLIVITFAYLICFVPASIVNFIEMFNPNKKIPQLADIISINLVFANHVNNPVIYGLLNKQYRQAFKKLLMNLKQRMHCSTSAE